MVIRFKCLNSRWYSVLWLWAISYFAEESQHTIFIAVISPLASAILCKRSYHSSSRVCLCVKQLSFLVREDHLCEFCRRCLAGPTFCQQEPARSLSMARLLPMAQHHLSPQQRSQHSQRQAASLPKLPFQSLIDRLPMKWQCLQGRDLFAQRGFDALPGCRFQVAALECCSQEAVSRRADLALRACTGPVAWLQATDSA